MKLQLYIFFVSTLLFVSMYSQIPIGPPNGFCDQADCYEEGTIGDMLYGFGRDRLDYLSNDTVNTAFWLFNFKALRRDTLFFHTNQLFEIEFWQAETLLYRWSGDSIFTTQDTFIVVDPFARKDLGQGNWAIPSGISGPIEIRGKIVSYQPVFPEVRLHTTVVVVTSLNNNTSNFKKTFFNSPNPFNSSTGISYDLTTGSQVTLKIYNLLGQEVAILVNKRQTPGRYEVKWEAMKFPSGVYFYRLETVEFGETKKMILLK